MSKHVRSLELHVHQPLFIRHPRSVTLAKSGAAYLPKVQDALERLAIGTREVFGRRRVSALTLRCAVSFAVNWLAPRLPDWLNAAGARQVDAGAGLHLDTSLTAFAIAAQGSGVALGRSSLATPELASGRLVMPFTRAVPITEAFHLLRPDNDSGHPDAAGFVAWLVAVAEKAP